MKSQRATSGAQVHTAGADQNDRVPAVYWIWLGGLGWTSTGLNLLHFGLVWQAAAHSPALAGVVLLAAVLPRALISLLGGSAADRVGPLKVMMVADAAMSVFLMGLVVVTAVHASSPALLLTAAAVLGLADAFYQPSSGGVPKFLVPNGALPRALAARQLITYGSGVAGPVFGGVAVSAAGLPLAFGLGTVGFLGMLVILLILRTRVSFAPTPQTDHAQRPHTLAQAKEGIILVWTSPLLRGIALLTVAFAAFVLPVTSLLIPLLAADHGWSAAVAGTASGAFGAGMALTASVVMVGRGAGRPGAAAIVGMLTAGVGVTGLAAASTEGTAVCAAFVAGVGTGVFATHLGPVFMAAVPPRVVGRSQAVLIMAQTLPLLVVQPLIGFSAELVEPAAITAVWGVGAMAVAVIASTSRGLRTVSRPC